MEIKEVYPKVFTWLFVGLLVTFITGYSLSLNKELLYGLSGGVSVVLLVIEFAVAIFFSLRLHKMSKTTAVICYLLYSFITGISLSGIFIIYKMSSIIFVFLVAALLFLVFAVIGKITKVDLSKIGTFLFMGLLAVIILSIINVFLGISGLAFIILIVSILIFLGYIAYDMKCIPNLVSMVGIEKAAVFGAFQLYLDFINLFIDLLRLFGKSDD